MFIKKMRIENLKSLKSVTINFNNSINVLTGENNAGKTTILESIALWCECFTLLIEKTKRSRNNIENGMYVLGKQRQNYFDTSKITSLRSPEFKDIFYNFDTSKEIFIEAEIADINKNIINIGFGIRGTSGRYDIYLHDYKQFDFEKFNNFFNNFPEPISILYASPVMSILYNEEFKTEPIIKSEVVSRNSTKVLRNRIYMLSRLEESYKEFLKDISSILSNGNEAVEFEIISDKLKDKDVKINIKIGNKDFFKDISLVGSGTIQIIEILLSFYEHRNDLVLVLLDEADSHLYKDLQERLIKVIIRHSQNTQIFITSHNESLIRNTDEKYLFFIEKDKEEEYYPIFNEKMISVKQGLAPSKYKKILQKLGNEDALDFLNALNSDLLIFVEGERDAVRIDLLLKKVNSKLKIMYWVFGGIDKFMPNISGYKEIFSNIKNGKSLWDKSIIILDKDYMYGDLVKKIEGFFESKIKMPIFFWDSYTFEGTFVKDIENISQIIETECGIDKSIIFEKMENIIKELKSVKYEKNISDANMEIENKLKERIKHLSKINKDAAVKFGEESPLGKALTYFREKKEYVEYFTRKEDIEEILKKLYNELGIEFDFDNKDIFEELIEKSNKLNLLNEWNRVIDFIIKR